MNLKNKFSIGQYVISKSGRDKDRIFIIVKIVDDNYVLVADGDLRKIENPKLKKYKHLSSVNKISQEIVDRIDNSKKITNLTVRREIEKLKENEA